MIRLQIACAFLDLFRYAQPFGFAESPAVWRIGSDPAFPFAGEYRGSVCARPAAAGSLPLLLEGAHPHPGKPISSLLRPRPQRRGLFIWLTTAAGLFQLLIYSGCWRATPSSSAAANCAGDTMRTDWSTEDRPKPSGNFWCQPGGTGDLQPLVPPNIAAL